MARTWILEDFTVGEELGRGKFGRVFAATEKTSQVRVALKTISQTYLGSEDRLKQLRREVELQCRLFHPNILRLFGYFWDKKMLVLVLQHAPNGTLFDRLRNTGSFPEAEGKRYVREVTSALAHVHGLGALHRDLKPENVLIGPEGQCLLGDFGWAAVVPKATGKRRTLCGTIDYLAPEVAAGRPYDFKADMWSLGVLMYEILVGSGPHTCKEVSEVSQLSSLRLPKGFSSAATDLCAKLLDVDPRHRPSAEEVVRHQWLCSG